MEQTVKESGYYFNGEQLTKESIEKAEQFYINNAQACIDEAVSGKVRVNDLESYIEWRKETIDAYTNKTYKMSLSFLQRAYFEQTGKSVALLP